MAPSILPPLSSYATALVLLPPPHIQSRINPLRSANDKSFPRWTSHLTLIFPFVEPASLPTACSLIRGALSKADIPPFSFKLEKVDMFIQREYDTVYLAPTHARDVHRLWDVISSAVGYFGRPFVPHLTLGQSYHRANNLSFLKGKGQLLLEQPIEWDICSIVVLQKSEAEGGLMKIYQEIFFSQHHSPPEAVIIDVRPATYRFGTESWAPWVPVPLQSKTITLATYNVLHDPNLTNSRHMQLISTLISIQPAPDALCLQEVTDEFFRHLLMDPRVRAFWPHCTHDPQSVLPNERNIVFLTCKTFEFTWEAVQLSSHKPAIVLQVDLDPNPLIVVGVHLTAGLNTSHFNIRSNELSGLLGFLRGRYSASPWILLGDFNLPTSQPSPSFLEDTFHDAWLTGHGSEDGGETYDPGSNILAAKTARECRSPQRYDRICVRTGTGMKINTTDMFALGDEAPSDHYGLTATVSLPSVEPEDLATPVVSLPHSTGEITDSRRVISDGELEEIVRQRGGYPTKVQQDERGRLLDILRRALSLPARRHFHVGTQNSEHALESMQPHSVVRFEFVPVGSFGLGVDTQDSDVDVLVVGNIPPRTFWSLARALLRKTAPTPPVSVSGVTIKESPPGIIVRRFVKDASVPMMELAIGGVHVDMQYCSAAKLLESWNDVCALPPTDPIFLLPAHSLRTLNAYRNMISVLRVLSTTSLPAFRLSYRAIKLFCISRGIYCSRLGYLGGIHITLLLTRIALLCSPDSSAMHLFRMFLATYADWDWADTPVTIPGVNDTTSYARVNGREPMVILSIEKPVLNVIQNGNQHTLNAIVSSFKNANRSLAEGVPWADFARFDGVCGTTFELDFRSCYKSFIKLDLVWWGSNAKARAWISFVESRLPHLLILLQTSSPQYCVRLWPARLADADSPGDRATGSHFYLLGLNSPVKPLSTKISASLLAFEDSLRRNERLYDSTKMFVSVSQVDLSQIPERITTPGPWLDDGIDPDDNPSDEEDVEESPDEGDDPNAAFAPISAKQLKKRRPQPLRGNNTPQVFAPKLRTSSDVYHRILWDRELNTEDYLIGYEDRFVGLKEMLLTRWKRDVEHEDFVPFHRVVHFRRKSDGVLVWDRRNKIDLMFGSGVQQE